MKQISRLLSTGILIVLISLQGFASEKRSQNREDIHPGYKWDLTDIYADWDAWEAGLKELDQKMDIFSALKGSLVKGPDSLLYALKLQDDLNMLSYKVYRYPQLTRDTDTRDPEVSAKFQQVMSLFAKFNTATSWFNPEMLEIPWETVKTWFEETAALKPYQYPVENLFRQQEHVLSEEKEKLLSYFTEFNSAPRNVYTELSTSDIQFPDVIFESGDTLTMTRGNYSKTLRTNWNQEDRKEAFEIHYKTFQENENTYAAIYKGVCQRDWANTQARNYASTLKAALDDDNVPLSVYENLVNTVKANVEPLKRYQQLRKKTLGLEEYHLFDSALPLVELNESYPYEDARKWVLASVKPLGQSYAKKMKKALAGGWIDVYENSGKRPGAYSATTYGVHPFMLLNYNETLNYVFTLAHELGHCMHSTLSNETQPYATHDYTIFVAEVASTLNEQLLLDYLFETWTDPQRRVLLLTQAIDNLVGTFFTQVMFADFEWQVHQWVEQGQPITASRLNELMIGLYKDYYGDSVMIDQRYEVLWARISHFYAVPYYVYQYATCFVSSAEIYKQMTTGSKTGKKEALNRYITLLKSGGNDYPMEQLKKAGVDLTQPEPVRAVIQQLDDMVSKLEKELERL